MTKSEVAVKTSVLNAIRKYFLTTTLHGFKYLFSPHYSDRVGWVVCCVASACCAGVLFGVVWARFAELPALLVQRQLDFQPVPTVGVCQPHHAVAETFLTHLGSNHTNIQRLAATFSNAIQGLPTEERLLSHLEYLFSVHQVSFIQVLNTYSPDCRDLARKCRWQNGNVPCEHLFAKTFTRWGVCCIADANRILNISVPSLLDSTNGKTLDMVLQCSNNGSSVHGCEYFTRYQGEEWVFPMQLSPGYNYIMHLTFTYEQDFHDDKIVDGTCISAKGYSQRLCLLKCLEIKCGCYNPLSTREKNHQNRLPPCSLKQMFCLKSFGYRDDPSCHCLPACAKVITKSYLEMSSFKNLHITLDPLHSEINATKSIFIRLKVNTRQSKMFSLLPTETWVTLLSSLGGIFNMFLGVGVFSALECLFFLTMKLPIAIQQSPEKYI